MTANTARYLADAAPLDGRHVDGPLADEAVEQRHAGDREGGHEGGDGGQRHELHQPAHLVEVLRAGRVQHRAGVEEQQGLEQPVVEDVEQRAEEADRGQRRGVGPHRRQQAHAGAGAQQDVADLADAVEGEQALGLFLLERLHRAGEQRDGAQQRDDQAPLGERVIGLPGGRHQPEEIAHQAVHAGLDHHAGEHGAHGRRRGGVRIRQPELAERPHAHLDAEPDQEQREGQRGGARPGAQHRGRFALTVSKSYFKLALPLAAAPVTASNSAPIIVAAQAICIMMRYLLAARMLAGFLCSNRISA